MQTKKRVSGRLAARENATAGVSRTRKNTSENVHITEKKSTELITSSPRKQKLGNTLSKRNGETVTATNLITRSELVHHEDSNACLDYDALNGASLNSKVRQPRSPLPMTLVSAENNAHQMSETIFSPAFHLSNTAGGDSEEVNANAVSARLNMALEGAHLSSEASAIYLAMKNSKLECVDEQGQDSMSDDVCVEDDDCEDFDDFDPYLFMKNLPDLSLVVPTFRPTLLPKQTRSCPSTTLVLDLDETLVHSTLESCENADFTFPVNFNCKEHTVYVRCRPHLKDFMERVASLFEIIIFTASQSIYAEQLLNVLDPKRKIFRHRVYRESCVFVDGNYLKDLSVLGRDLARVIIIDNSPQAFGFQVDNGIPIESWFEDSSDQELLSILPFLECLVGVEDVRTLIAKKFNLREKIAAAVYNPIYLTGDRFER